MKLSKIHALLAILLFLSELHADPIKRGLKFLHRQKYQNAEALFTKALRKDSNNAAALYGFSRVKTIGTVGDENFSEGYLAAFRAVSLYEGQLDQLRDYKLQATDIVSNFRILDSLYFYASIRTLRINSLDQYIKVSKDGDHLRYCINKRDSILVDQAMQKQNPEALEKFLIAYPNSIYSEMVKDSIVERHLRICNLAKDIVCLGKLKNRFGGVTKYLVKIQESIYLTGFTISQKYNSYDSLYDYARNNPNSPYSYRANALADSLRLNKLSTIDALEKFIRENPNSGLIQAANNKMFNMFTVNGSDTAKLIEFYRRYPKSPMSSNALAKYVNIVTSNMTDPLGCMECYRSLGSNAAGIKCLEQYYILYTKNGSDLKGLKQFYRQFMVPSINNFVFDQIVSAHRWSIKDCDTLNLLATHFYPNNWDYVKTRIYDSFMQNQLPLNISLKKTSNTFKRLSTSYAHNFELKYFQEVVSVLSASEISNMILSGSFEDRHVPIAIYYYSNNFGNGSMDDYIGTIKKIGKFYKSKGTAEGQTIFNYTLRIVEENRYNTSGRVNLINPRRYSNQCGFSVESETVVSSEYITNSYPFVYKADNQPSMQYEAQPDTDISFTGPIEKPGFDETFTNNIVNNVKQIKIEYPLSEKNLTPELIAAAKYKVYFDDSKDQNSNFIIDFMTYFRPEKLKYMRSVGIKETEIYKAGLAEYREFLTQNPFSYTYKLDIMKKSSINLYYSTEYYSPLVYEESSNEYKIDANHVPVIHYMWESRYDYDTRQYARNYYWGTGDVIYQSFVGVQQFDFNGNKRSDTTDEGIYKYSPTDGEGIQVLNLSDFDDPGYIGYTDIKPVMQISILPIPNKGPLLAYVHRIELWYKNEIVKSIVPKHSLNYWFPNYSFSTPVKVVNVATDNSVKSTTHLEIDNVYTQSVEKPSTAKLRQPKKMRNPFYLEFGANLLPMARVDMTVRYQFETESSPGIEDSMITALNAQNRIFCYNLNLGWSITEHIPIYFQYNWVEGKYKLSETGLGLGFNIGRSTKFNFQSTVGWFSRRYFTLLQEKVTGFGNRINANGSFIQDPKIYVLNESTLLRGTFGFNIPITDYIHLGLSGNWTRLLSHSNGIYLNNEDMNTKIEYNPNDKLMYRTNDHSYKKFSGEEFKAGGWGGNATLRMIF
ncbi:MAG: hypothetical protein JNL57_00760 [Bacteroidetes bacterium]|nr:hypothetical protein [Bacteroidota bacterium]